MHGVHGVGATDGFMLTGDSSVSMCVLMRSFTLLNGVHQGTLAIGPRDFYKKV